LAARSRRAAVVVVVFIWFARCIADPMRRRDKVKRIDEKERELF
jgi:hypothetical protein